MSLPELKRLMAHCMSYLDDYNFRSFCMTYFVTEDILLMDRFFDEDLDFRDDYKDELGLMGGTDNFKCETVLQLGEKYHGIVTPEIIHELRKIKPERDPTFESNITSLGLLRNLLNQRGDSTYSNYHNGLIHQYSRIIIISDETLQIIGGHSSVGRAAINIPIINEYFVGGDIQEFVDKGCVFEDMSIENRLRNTNIILSDFMNKPKKSARK